MNRSVFDKTTKIWKGAGKPTPEDLDPNVSMGTWLLRALEKRPDLIGQISDNNGIKLLNSEIRKRSIDVAHNLKKLGLKSGDVVQVITKNHHFLAPVIFGAIFNGLPVNALDVKFTKDEVVYMLKLASPRLIICDNDVVRTVKEALVLAQTTIPIYVFDSETDGVHSVSELLVDTSSDGEFEIDDLNAVKYPVIVVCTSGSTGHPKGVSLSHISLLESCLRTAAAEEDLSVQAFLNFSSLYWLTGWTTLLAGTLRSIKRIITTEPFSTGEFLRMIEQYKATYVLTPPHYLALTLQDSSLSTRDLSSIKAYVVTGGMASHELCMKMNKHLKSGLVFIAYAMSETAGPITVALSAFHPNSVGPLMPGAAAKIINENGVSCDPGVEGEICFLPNYPFMGYYRDEVNTKKAVDPLGWLHTGDVGYFDENGLLYMVGRQKEILKYLGNQISPAEIEDVILKHSGVSNVCVVGIPDEMAGDLPAAVVMANGEIDTIKNEIMELVKEKLSDPKQIRGGIYFVDELPETPSGKILRRKVQELAIENFKKERSQ